MKETKNKADRIAKHGKASKAARSAEARRSRHAYIATPKGIALQALKYILMYFVFLFYWETVLGTTVYGSPVGRGVWTVIFLIPISVFLSALTGWSRSIPGNQIGAIVVTVVMSIFYSAELIYFNSFGSLFSFSMIGMGGDAITNFWWALAGTLRASIPMLLLMQVPTLFLALIKLLIPVEKILRLRGYRARYHLIMLVLSVVCWLLVVVALPLGGTSESTAYGAYHSKFTDTDTGSEMLGTLANMVVEVKTGIFGSAEGSGMAGMDQETAEDGESEPDGAAALGGAMPGQESSPESGAEAEAESETENETETEPAEDIHVGIHAYENVDFNELAGKTEDKDIKSICEYLAKVQPTNKNQYTGLFEGYNLIYICAESFSSYAVNEAVTPTLYKMAHEGIVLNNYYNSFKNTTTNGEYVLLSGIWPDVSRKAMKGSAVGSMPSTADHNMMPSIGNMFNSIGLVSRGFHNYDGEYYSRDKSWPNMGFTCKFRNAGMEFTSRWPSSDLEMMEQSIPDYINDDQFMTYYMTFSGHGGYTTENNIVKKNRSTVKSLLKEADIKMVESQVGYLSANYELEAAVKYLMEELEKAGKLDKTVIVIAADHYPYYVKENTRNKFAGHDVDTVFEMYKSTCIMYCAGLKQPIVVDDPCCNVDILPTLLNLFNIPFDSRLYAGVDIFSDSVHMAQLYNRNVITDKVMYDRKSDKATWLEGTENMSEDEKKLYLETFTSLANQRYNLSLAIEDTDFYKFLWENVEGLPVKAEIAAIEKVDSGESLMDPAMMEGLDSDDEEE